ncbi:MAG TPA: amino acid ABC transporter permease [Ktedonobacterales bacterium]
MINPIQNFLKTYDFATVGKYWHHSLILQGIIITILLAVLAQLLGALIGLLLYFMRRARLYPVRWLAEVYIWFFRGTPLYVQILFAYLLLPDIGWARPLRSFDIFTSLGFSGVLTDSMVAALAALALNEGAYMAEIVRAGIDSIDPGQMEAAKSLGMTYWLGMRRVVLPQAMRVIIPPLGNEFNSMLKSTSLVSAISVYELLGASEAIGTPIFKPLELLTIAVFWYLILTSIWTVFQYYLERRFSASTRDPGASKSIWQRLGLGSLLSPNRGIPAVR